MWFGWSKRTWLFLSQLGEWGGGRQFLGSASFPPYLWDGCFFQWYIRKGLQNRAQRLPVCSEGKKCCPHSKLDICQQAQSKLIDYVASWHDMTSQSHSLGLIAWFAVRAAEAREGWHCKQQKRRKATASNSHQWQQSNKGQMLSAHPSSCKLPPYPQPCWQVKTERSSTMLDI